MKKDKLIKYIFVNALTVSRIVGSIIMPISYFQHGIGVFALFVCILFFTDFLDGKLSRMWKVESFFGGLMDGVADKVFAFVMLAILSYEYPSVLIVIVLELVILISSVLAFNKNKNVQSSKIGKRKTVILDVSISLMYIYLARDLYSPYLSIVLNYYLNKGFDSIIHILIGVMVGLELLTIGDYIKKRNISVSYEKIKGKKLKSKKEILFMFTNRDFYIENKDKSLKELLYK